MVVVELSEVSSEESSEDEVVLSVLEVLAGLPSSDFAQEETITEEILFLKVCLIVI